MIIITKEEIGNILLKEYNLEQKKITQIKNGVQNTNYFIIADNGEYIFRIYNYKHRNEIQYTIKILKKLQNYNFPSPRLITSNNGNSFCFIKGKPCILYNHIPGNNTRQLSENLLKQLGTLQGKMHVYLINETQDYHIITWDLKDLLYLIDNRREAMLTSGFPHIKKRVEFIESELRTLQLPENLPKGGTHQDIKPENVLVKDGHIEGIIDFDNGYYGELIHDITTTLCWYCFAEGKFQREYAKVFIDSYQRERDLQEIERDSYRQSMKYRFLREAIIWPMYVSHNIPVAKKYSDYFINLYNNVDIKELL